MDLDEEYELICEADQLDFQIRYNEAEHAVLEQEYTHALLAKLDGHAVAAESWSMYREMGEIIGWLDRREPPTSYDIVERCCYDLRRKHRQWPTGPQLAERIATEAGTTYAMAEFLIDQAINERTDAARLYLALWMLGNEPRLFIDASAVERLDHRYMGRLALEAA